MPVLCLLVPILVIPPLVPGLSILGAVLSPPLLGIHVRRAVPLPFLSGVFFCCAVAPPRLSGTSVGGTVATPMLLGFLVGGLARVGRTAAGLSPNFLGVHVVLFAVDVDRYLAPTPADSHHLAVVPFSAVQDLNSCSRSELPIVRGFALPAQVLRMHQVAVSGDVHKIIAVPAVLCDLAIIPLVLVEGFHLVTGGKLTLSLALTVALALAPFVAASACALSTARTAPAVAP
mmetsp:Transcript_97790/g.276611  ORF Transcript_97790/g.276611 Transcript_97790/m.276611 type:complete len:231 (-) Transcript_97790:1288-1980(-)